MCIQVFSDDAGSGDDYSDESPRGGIGDRGLGGGIGGNYGILAKSPIGPPVLSDITSAHKLGSPDRADVKTPKRLKESVRNVEAFNRSHTKSELSKVSPPGHASHGSHRPNAKSPPGAGQGPNSPDKRDPKGSKQRYIPLPKGVGKQTAEGGEGGDAEANEGLLAGYYDTFASRSKLGRTPVSSLFADEDEFDHEGYPHLELPANAFVLTFIGAHFEL